MKKSKAAPLTASLLARKGEARPAKTQVTIYDLTKSSKAGTAEKLPADQLSLEGVETPVADEAPMVQTAEVDQTAAPRRKIELRPVTSDQASATGEQTADEPSMAQVLAESAPEAKPVLPEPKEKLKSYGPISVVSETDEAQASDTAAASEDPEPAADESQDAEIRDQQEEPAGAVERDDGPPESDEDGTLELDSGQAVEAGSSEPDVQTEQHIDPVRPLSAIPIEEQPRIASSADDGKQSPTRLAPPYMPRGGSVERELASRQRQRYAMAGGAALVAAGLVVAMWFAYNSGIEQAEVAEQRVIESAAVKAERFPPISTASKSAKSEAIVGDEKPTPPVSTETAEVLPGLQGAKTQSSAPETPAPVRTATAVLQKPAPSAPVVAPTQSEPVKTAEVPKSVEPVGDTSAGSQTVSLKVPPPPPPPAPTTASPTSTQAAKPGNESKATVPAAPVEKAKAEEKTLAKTDVPPPPAVGASAPSEVAAKPAGKATAPTPPVPTKSLAAAKAGTNLAAVGENAVDSKKLAALAPAAKAAAPSGNFAIQLSSVRSVAAAKTEWVRLRRVHGDLLKTLPVRYQKASVKDKGTYFRVQVGEMQKSAARKLCAQLKKRKQGCLVVKR